MPKRAHDTDTGWRAASAMIVTALALLLAACSDAGGVQISDPRAGVSAATPSAVAPSALATSDAAAAAAELVTQRYVEFQRVVAETGATSDADDRRLPEYATGSVLENLRGKLAVRRQSGTQLYGMPMPHVQSVSVSGGRATVVDCLDNSRTGLVDRAGKKLSVGRERQETTAVLVLEDGVWKVSEIATIAGGGSC
jgi:hypothetical protein